MPSIPGRRLRVCGGRVKPQYVSAPQAPALLASLPALGLSPGANTTGLWKALRPPSPLGALLPYHCPAARLTAAGANPNGIMNHSLHKVRALALLVLGCSFLFAAAPAEASHFRYGFLSWEPTGSPGQIEFDLTAAFRRSGYFGSAADSRPAVGDIITETVGATGLSFGDGSQTGTLRFVVIALSVSEDWLIGRALNPGTDDPGILKTYANTSNSYTAQARTCCRIFGLNNRSSATYDLSTTVTFDGNASPTTSLLPIVTVDESATASFIIPASDPDGDPIRYRIATAAEAGGGPSPPNISIDAVTGQVTWNNVGLNQSSPWTVQVIIEDLDSSGDVKTQTPVDFLLRIQPRGANNPPVCSVSPAGPFSVAPGATLSFSVSASDPDPGDTVELNTGGLPTGATMSPTLPTSGSPSVSSTFSWTPTAAQLGTYNVIFSATDQSQAQTLCSAQIAVRPTAACPPSDFTQTVDRANRRILLAISDPEGISRVDFTDDVGNPVLVNLVASSPHMSSTDGIHFLPNDPSNPPTRADFELEATDDRVRYFARITNECGTDTVIDPPHDFGTSTEDGAPVAFSVNQNYPNPFSGRTSISFQMEEAAQVRVAVYDFLGREVIVLQDALLGPGSHTVIWDGLDAGGRSVASGAYLYRVEAGGLVETRQMTLLQP